jgi:CBS domain-containing protein
VVSVERGTPVVQAFQTMLAKGATAVAVMDGAQLVANLSAAELRGMQPQQFGDLALPVGEFLLTRAAAERTRHLPGSPAAAYGVHAPTPVAAIAAPAVCATDASVAHAVQVMVERQVHRVYLVAPGQGEEGAAAGAPVGVLSTSDLIMALLG